MSLMAAALTLIGASIPLSIAGADAGASSAGNTDVVAARADIFERMTVPVRIGDGVAWRFLVDTGAQNTVVSNELARRLALTTRGTARVVGIAGDTRVDIVTLDGLQLGRRSFNGLIAPLLREADIGADGIVGLDSLQRQRVLLDFVHGAIAIDDAPGPGSEGFDIVVRARRRSGELIMTSARIDGIRVDVVIDTGSGVTIGNPALLAALHRRAPASKALLQSVTGQSVLADVDTARDLTLGGMALENVTIAYTDAPPFAKLGLDKRPAILLGMRELRAFKRVAIDFNQRKVLFDFHDPGGPSISFDPQR